MRTLVVLAFVVILCYILSRQYKAYKYAREVGKRARRRSMEIERDRQVCRELERLLFKEDQ